MKSLPTNPTASFKKRNPHLYPGQTGIMALIDEPKTFPHGMGDVRPPKRIRQSTKPLMNKLESRFFDTFGDAKRLVLPQAVTFRLANGVRFTPDFFSFRWICQNVERPTAWEVKGPWFTDDAKVKIKLFAAAYPDVLVLLASEDKPTGMWTMQIVLP